MKTTNPEITRRLHELMLHDMAASDVYHVQSVMFEDWGYHQLAAKLGHESLHEREHVKMQLDRLIFLEIPIDLSLRPVMKVGTTPRECLEIGLAMETKVAGRLNELIKLCTDEKDAVTRQIADQLLEDTEMDHILWLETQLRLMDQLGEQAYLAEQMQPAKEQPAG